VASSSKVWIGRLLVAVVVPLLVLGALEMALRVVGYGHSTRYFVEAEDQLGNVSRSALERVYLA